MKWIMQQFLLPALSSETADKWLQRSLGSAVGFGLASVYCKDAQQNREEGLVLSYYYCMETKGQLSQLQSFCIKHCLHRAISLATDLFSQPEGRVLLVFGTKGGKLVVENRTPSWLELVQAGIAGKCLCTQLKGQGLVVLVSHASLSRGKG